jgi:uncharacterized protein (TIGR04255 family)
VYSIKSKEEYMPRRRVLKNAPVVYLLAQVKFAPVLAMGKYIADIQDVLRKSGLEHYNEDRIKEYQINVTDDAAKTEVQEISHWQFQNSEKTEAVVLGVDTFVFHATSYEDFEKFLSRVIPALGTVSKFAQLARVTQIGLRYVDILPPDDGGGAERYLVGSLQGIEGAQLSAVEGVDHIDQLKAERTRRMFESVYKTQFGLLIQRVIENTGAPALAPDVLQSKLKLSEPTPKEGARFVTLDTDHFASGLDQEFELGGIEAMLRGLHIGTSASFFSVFTDEGVSSWE